MIKAIIFDYDGVIVDSFPSVFAVYRMICDRLGKQCPDDIDAFRKVYGYSSDEFAKNLGFSADEWAESESIFKKEILKKESALFPGIIETLAELHKKYKLVVISSNNTEEVMQKLERFGMTNYFDIAIGTRTPQGRVPKMQAIKETMQKLGVAADEVILIGDRDVDHDDGAAAGLTHIVLVEYGWGYSRDKYPQKVVVENPIDIIKAVQAIDA